MQSRWSQDLYIRAYRFAATAHQGQLVPGSVHPYILHLSLVSMEIMAALPSEPEADGDLAVRCALLHDVLEDTPVQYDQLRNEFGPPVANGVRALTKDETLAKHLRMTDSLQRIRCQPREIPMVKLADRITNLQPPPRHWNREKIRNYRLEAITIYDALKDASDFLADRLSKKIEAYRLFTCERG
ncbi:phosphohydrolase [Desulfonema ishimotonii]|uniref:Phosphohydrolase n=1 Tax=Desulfonema ishimotonii TaxID=45657 RepID=A0A401FS14_9BACT|nr:HD domain-containing protein [Desulfonema ishimotonii]GBC59755.1 phosphohydrolase [Desulfonema ishimotonii]